MATRLREAKRPVTRLAGPYGHPFHPILVTVPIGAWVASFVFDLASRLSDEPTVFAKGAFWLIGLRARETGASRFPPGLIFGHFLLAATGLVIWIIYVVTDADALTWVALAILVVVAALGFTMVGRWRQDRAAVTTAGRTDAARPPEQHFPVAVVYLHGLLAVATLILVLLTALGVGS